MAEPLSLYATHVQPEWLDYNNHMTEGYYAVAFGFATDAVLFHIGLKEHKAKTGCTFYTAQTMITFHREVKLGAPLRFTTQVLGVDRKRLHLYHQMFHAKEGFLAASAETMQLHYDQNVSQVTAMPDDLYDRIEIIAREHASLPIPEVVGRGVRKVEKSL